MIVGKKRAQSKLKKFHLYYGGAIGAVLLFAFSILAVLFMSGGDLVSLQPAEIEVTACQIIDVAGSYYLNSDVTSATGENCFEIMIDDVILDGRNYEINTDVVSEKSAILINGSNISIKDLTIRNPTSSGGYANGIKINEGTSSSFLSNITLLDRLIDLVLRSA